MRKDDLRRYVIWRMKSLELLHFYLLLFDLNNKRYCPENMLGHDARMFASSIRTVTISWLATFVDQSRDGMNVFDLWRRLFPKHRKEIDRVWKRLEPQLELIKTFRDRVGFHADTALKYFAARDRIRGKNPELQAAMDSFIGRGRGSLGLASVGVTIYLPLSPTLCIAMTDPALMEQLFEGARRVRAGYEEFENRIAWGGLPAGAAAFVKEMKENRDRVNQQIEPMEAGTPFPHVPEVVTRVNSLQMLHASRWIVSSKPDFSLPLKMLADDPGLRARRKLAVE
jgi:hypothetical protein